MTEKDWTGMMQCFYCGEVMGILIDRRMAKTLPREGCYDVTPCGECAEWMNKGIILISVFDGQEPSMEPNRSGGFAVVKEEAFKEMFGDEHPALRHRFSFVEDEVWEAVGLEEIIEERESND